jgi:hypothetical protein
MPIGIRNDIWLALATLTAAGAMALLAAPVGAKQHERSITIQVRGQLEHVQPVDSAPAGESAGDVLVFTERLFDRRGRRVGSDAAHCVRLFDATWLCTGTYKLPGGRVMVQLLLPGPAVTYDQAITGGTGRFAGARGTVTVVQRPDGDRFTFRIRLGGDRV